VVGVTGGCRSPTLALLPLHRFNLVGLPAWATGPRYTACFMLSGLEYSAFWRIGAFPPSTVCCGIRSLVSLLDWGSKWPSIFSAGAKWNGAMWEMMESALGWPFASFKRLDQISANDSSEKATRAARRVAAALDIRSGATL
jgi:hypothetical protein